MSATSLAAWTTFGLGGPAERFVLADTEAALIEVVRGGDELGEGLTVLGGGSNVLVADAGLRGTVVRVATRGITLARENDQVCLTAAAGEPWDGVVARAVEEGLGGIECLSGIPGLVGATPVQNVGAYGQEVAETITAVRVWDRAARTVRTLGPAECAFGYRDSALKRDRARTLVVLSVSFALRPGRCAAPRYGELSRALGEAPPTLAGVRASVLRLRRAKGMVFDLDDPDARGAGSFFTNPVVSSARADAIESLVRQGDPTVAMPRFAAPGGAVKLAAGWLIEHAGVRRGDRCGGAAVSRRHALALVNPEGRATAAEVVALATRIRDAVWRRFGVALEPEVVGLGFASGGLLAPPT